MKLSELKGQGIADQACHSYGQVLQTIREVDAEEARDTVAASYREMWAFSERLAEHVANLRSLGHKNLREMRVLEILDNTIKALEQEGVGA
jgi:hypothetical protein